MPFIPRFSLQMNWFKARASSGSPARRQGARTSASLCCFPRPYAGCWMGSGLQVAPTWDARAAGRGLTYMPLCRLQDFLLQQMRTQVQHETYLFHFLFCNIPTIHLCHFILLIFSENKCETPLDFSICLVYFNSACCNLDSTLPFFGFGFSFSFFF